MEPPYIVTVLEVKKNQCSTFHSTTEFTMKIFTMNMNAQSLFSLLLFISISSRTDVGHKLHESLKKYFHSNRS